MPELSVALKELEESRESDGTLGIEEFSGVHLACGQSVKTVPPRTVNSSEIDPATSDPLPIQIVRLYCEKHGVYSKYEELKS